MQLQATSTQLHFKWKVVLQSGQTVNQIYVSFTPPSIESQLILHTVLVLIPVESESKSPYN